MLRRSRSTLGPSSAKLWRNGVIRPQTRPSTSKVDLPNCRVSGLVQHTFLMSWHRAEIQSCLVQLFRPLTVTPNLGRSMDDDHGQPGAVRDGQQREQLALHGEFWPPCAIGESHKSDLNRAWRREGAQGQQHSGRPDDESYDENRAFSIEFHVMANCATSANGPGQARWAADSGIYGKRSPASPAPRCWASASSRWDQHVSTLSTWQTPHHDASFTQVAVRDAETDIPGIIPSKTGRVFRP